MLRILSIFVILAGLLAPPAALLAEGLAHPPLGSEGIYDPSNPALPFLQPPQAALGLFPMSPVGNNVDWMEALDGGFIAPRKGLDAGAPMNVIDMDVLMSQTASMPHVNFPHRQHTQWLGCNNCHPQIFLPKKDGNPVTMYAILNKQYCGVCHGTVAFPLSDCFRCHNTPRDKRSLWR